jgi:hypothetical protein
MQALLTFLRIWPDKKHDFPFAMLEAQRQVLPRGVCPSYSFCLRIDWNRHYPGGSTSSPTSGCVSVLQLLRPRSGSMSGCGSSSWIIWPNAQVSVLQLLRPRSGSMSGCGSSSWIIWPNAQVSVLQLLRPRSGSMSGCGSSSWIIWPNAQVSVLQLLRPRSLAKCRWTRDLHTRHWSRSDPSRYLFRLVAEDRPVNSHTLLWTGKEDMLLHARHTSSSSEEALKTVSLPTLSTAGLNPPHLPHRHTVRCRYRPFP